jgi:hypothetical protein
VYIGAIRPWWRKPKISVGDVDTKLSGWLRAPVTNANNRNAAEDVQVILRSAKSGPSREQLKDRDLAGFAPMWTAIDDGKALLPPGVTRYINIGYVVSDDTRATEPKFTLDLHKRPGDDRPAWSCAFAQIDVVIAARNANALVHQFCIRFENGEATPC